MIDPRTLREDPDGLRRMLAERGAAEDVESLVALDGEYREVLARTEQLKAKRNRASDEIGKCKRRGEDAGELLGETKKISGQIKELDAELRGKRERLEDALLRVPNFPDAEVPRGSGERENKVHRSWGDPPTFDFEPKAHWEIGEGLGIMDFERAAKLAGARFVVLRDEAARLERALINFMLDVHTKENGYREILPPFFVNRKTMTGTGQLPKFVEDLFHCEGTDYYLIPTAEVPLTNLHAGEILRGEDLPLSYTACTPCFRAEAGSWGKDTRGILRQHQFDKVELVKITTPEQSAAALEELTGHAEGILQRLGLPYRVNELCTGDLGFAAARTYDLEVWIPWQRCYREISSCSNCRDFQARRMNTRFRGAGGGRPELVHTLNGSGVAVGRTLLAILEDFQDRDGRVRIPGVLVPYMGGQETIGAAPA